jgi:hypothetical protein
MPDLNVIQPTQNEVAPSPIIVLGTTAIGEVVTVSVDGNKND